MGVNEGFVVDLSRSYILASVKLLMLGVDSQHLPVETVNLSYHKKQT